MSDKKILRLTAHYLDNYEACPLAFHRITNLKRGAASKPSKLARGTAMHSILADYYKGMRDEMDYSENVTKSVDKFQVDAMDIPGLLVEDIDPIIKTFYEYTEHYLDQDHRLKILTVEETLSKVLYEDENYIILWEGTRDMDVLQDGVVIPYDHKTEGSKTTPSKLSNQFMGYVFLTGEPRLIRNAIGFQKSKKPAEKFYRTMYSYSQSDIDWWRFETIRKGIKIIQSYDRNVWPANFNACDLMHRSGCEFRPVCSESQDMWDTMLENDYVHVELYDRKKLKGQVYEA